MGNKDEASLSELWESVKFREKSPGNRGFLKKSILVFALFLLGSIYFLRGRGTEEKKESTFHEVFYSTLLSKYESMLKAKTSRRREKPVIRVFQKEIEDHLARFDEELKQREKEIGGHTLELVSRGPVKEKKLALTVDLGTGKKFLEILRILKRRKSKATFFLSNTRENTNEGSLFGKDIALAIQEAMALGCEFGNHTWNHKNLYKRLYDLSSFRKEGPLTFSELEKDLGRVARRLRALGGKMKPYFRPPYGHSDQRIDDAVALCGYSKLFTWTHGMKGSMDLLDYVTRPRFKVYSKKLSAFIFKKNPFYRTNDETLEFLLEEEGSHPHGLRGAILLMHAGTARKKEILVHGLEKMISTFQEKGYRFVTLSELMDEKQAS